MKLAKLASVAIALFGLTAATITETGAMDSDF